MREDIFRLELVEHQLRRALAGVGMLPAPVLEGRQGTASFCRVRGFTLGKVIQANADD